MRAHSLSWEVSVTSSSGKQSKADTVTFFAEEEVGAWVPSHCSRLEAAQTQTHMSLLCHPGQELRGPSGTGFQEDPSGTSSVAHTCTDTPMCTQAHTLTCIYVCIHMYAHSRASVCTLTCVYTPHAYMHLYAHTHTQANSCIYLCTHSRTCTLIRASLHGVRVHTHTHAHSFTSMHTLTCAHTSICTRSRACTRTHMHLYANSCVHTHTLYAHVHTCAHSHAHSFVHLYVHAHVHEHTCTDSCISVHTHAHSCISMCTLTCMHTHSHTSTLALTCIHTSYTHSHALQTSQQLTLTHRPYTPVPWPHELALHFIADTIGLKRRGEQQRKEHRYINGQTAFLRV